MASSTADPPPPSADPLVALICAVGFGYLSWRLWTTATTLQAKPGSLEARLAAAPTIPFSALMHRRISSDGELVLVQGGVVSPLVDHDQYRRLSMSSGGEAVVVKTVEYTDQPKEFRDVYRGFWLEQVSKIPFALVAEGSHEGIDDDYDSNSNNNNDVFVVYVKADADHLPLVQENDEKSPLDPPVFLTKKVSMKSGSEDGDVESEEMDDVASRVIQVNRVTWRGYLGVGARLKNVFGVLRRRSNGVVEIEPCPLFPKKCFTMSRSEIQVAVRAEANNGELFRMNSMKVRSVVAGGVYVFHMWRRPLGRTLGKY